MKNAKWLVDQDLVYTLKDSANHWEVRVTMVAGSRDMADRTVAANQLRAILEKENEQASQPQAMMPTNYRQALEALLGDFEVILGQSNEIHVQEYVAVAKRDLEKFLQTQAEISN